MNQSSQVSWWRQPPATSAVPRLHDISKSLPQASGSMLPFWALMTFTFILLLAPQERFPFLAPLRIALLSAVLAAMAHVGTRLMKGQPLVEINKALILVGCLTGWAILMVPFSYWPGGSVGYLLNNFFKTLIVFVLLANVINTFTKLRWISWGLVLMTVPLALTTIKNMATGNTFKDSDRVIGYMASLTANPNDLALMLNLILPLAIALFLGTRGTGTKLILGGVIALIVAAIIGTFSRGGFLTLGLIFISYLWLLRNRRERMWGPILIVLMVAALPMVPSSYYDRINTIVNIEEDESGSAQTRFGDMQVAAKIVITNPLIGAGIGQNQLAMNEARGLTWTEIHNVYLQLAVELGFPGLLLFLALLFTCVSYTSTVLRRTRNVPHLRGLHFIAEGLRVSLFAYALAGMFHPTAYHFYFYYIAGLAVAVRSICATEVQAMRIANDH